MNINYLRKQHNFGSKTHMQLTFKPQMDVEKGLQSEVNITFYQNEYSIFSAKDILLSMFSYLRIEINKQLIHSSQSRLLSKHNTRIKRDCRRAALILCKYVL
jgi:hypothetical protein